jgi:hypothetical protein
MIRLTVIECDLLAWLDVPQSEKQDVAVDDFAVAVRLAGVIDELCPVAASAPVNRPVRVNAGDVDALLVFQPACDFVAGDLFAGVFGDLPAFFETNRGEASFAVNRRWFDFDAVSGFDPHLQISNPKSQISNQKYR